jgi:hypothetical protein
MSKVIQLKNYRALRTRKLLQRQPGNKQKITIHDLVEQERADRERLIPLSEIWGDLPKTFLRVGAMILEDMDDYPSNRTSTAYALIVLVRLTADLQDQCRTRIPM